MRENSYILCKLYIGQLQYNSHSVFRPIHKPTVYLRYVLGQCDTCHWHLKTVEHIYWLVVCSSSQLTADRCSDVMLKANKAGTMLDLCRCRQMWCDRGGKHGGTIDGSGTLTAKKLIIFRVLRWKKWQTVVSIWFRCASSKNWKKLSICHCFVQFVQYLYWEQGSGCDKEM